ncbi:MAG: serine/threonine-protein phosphatase [Corynebacteriales bacterium]|nr:serine/threonine-protein phosphatase [Mycobacteriales bacterium]
MSLTMRYAARSDRGLIREANEDSVYAGARLLAVADGMGGMAAGEVASNIVIAALAPLDEDAPGVDLVDSLRNAIENANSQLRHAVEENPALEGMGTTLTAALFSGNRIALVHVGDSRAYVWREGVLTQITRDDTYVQMLVDEGRITADEATTHPQRSLLTRALDGREVDPDSSVREARPGDRYLLCSDGLSGVVSAETMSEALAIPEPGEAADRLIALALRGGGPDNITCIVADVVNAITSDDEPVVGGAASHDRGRSTAATDDSAAGRAALSMSGPEPPPDLPDDDEPRIQPTPPKKRKRAALIVGIVLALLAIAALGGWYYTQQQYYLGVTDSGNIAIYRGVKGSLGGLKFSKVVEESNLKLDDLPPVTRQDVEDTIWASSRSDANDQLARLRSKRLEPCDELTSNTPEPSPSPSPSPTSGESPSPSPSSTSSPGPKKEPTPNPGVNCRKSGAGARSS